MHARARTIVCCLVPFFAACASPPPPPRPPPKTYTMETPSYLTAAARLKIRSLMKVHREGMSGLFNSMLVLDRANANHYAEVIASQPPLAQDPSLPADEQIPQRVIDLQKELHAKAEGVIELLNRKERVSSTELANGFSTLAAVCVTCHSEYLYPDQ